MNLNDWPMDDICYDKNKLDEVIKSGDYEFSLSSWRGLWIAENMDTLECILFPRSTRNDRLLKREYAKQRNSSNECLNCHRSLKQKYFYTTLYCTKTCQEQALTHW